MTDEVVKIDISTAEELCDRLYLLVKENPDYFHGYVNNDWEIRCVWAEVIDGGSKKPLTYLFNFPDKMAFHRARGFLLSNSYANENGQLNPTSIVTGMEAAQVRLATERAKAASENRRFWLEKFIAPVVVGVVVGLAVFFITSHSSSKEVTDRVGRLEERVNHLAVPMTPPATPASAAAGNMPNKL